MLAVFFRFSVSAVTAVVGLVMKLILVAFSHSSVSIFAVVLGELGFTEIYQRDTFVFFGIRCRIPLLC